MASLDAGFEGPIQPRQLDDRNVPRPPFFEKPFRSLGQHDALIGIEKSSHQLQSRSHATEKYQLLPGRVGANKCGGAVPARGICGQFHDLHASGTTSKRSKPHERRYKHLHPSSFKQRESNPLKVEKEHKSRIKQMKCLQNMEDLLECGLSWQIPRKQAPGNMKSSGMVGDKQQTMEAFYILNEVLFRHVISPLEPRPGETCIQAVVREAKHQIKTHLHGNSASELPTSSLMADAASPGVPLCTATPDPGVPLRTIKPDHEECLLDRTSACIRCRKQRRHAAFRSNLSTLSANHCRAPSDSSSSNLRRAICR